VIQKNKNMGLKIIGLQNIGLKNNWIRGKYALVWTVLGGGMAMVFGAPNTMAENTVEFGSPANSTTTDESYSAASITRSQRFRGKPWYKKLNYFLSEEQEIREISMISFPLDSTVASEQLEANYKSSRLSFSVGGNLFKDTSVYLDLTFNRFSLDGNIEDNYTDSSFSFDKPVSYDRNQTATEMFIEYDLGWGVSTGLDLYMGGDKFLNSDQGGSSTNKENNVYKEYGVGIQLSKQFTFDSSFYRLDYILSHREIKIRGVMGEEIHNRFHNLISSYHYTLSHAFSTDINARISYYPSYDPSLFWDARYITSVGAEVNYQLFSMNQLSARIERLDFGSSSGSHANVATVRIEHRFGRQSSKRRIRRYKMPNFLIN